ncbi:hypothetical protein VTL71DRAFT_13035 [Oculimacula yallundae]|uniref:Uncharacterized protein n=1 Tax=Oculimacula yallundae TaxID=86028 RepID=A0ABR4CPP1_9HELO
MRRPKPEHRVFTPIQAHLGTGILTHETAWELGHLKVVPFLIMLLHRCAGRCCCCHECDELYSTLLVGSLGARIAFSNCLVLSDLGTVKRGDGKKDAERCANPGERSARTPWYGTTRRICVVLITWEVHHSSDGIGIGMQARKIFIIRAALDGQLDESYEDNAYGAALQDVGLVYADSAGDDVWDSIVRYLVDDIREGDLLCDGSKH